MRWDGEPDALIGRDLIVHPAAFAALEAMIELRLVEQLVANRGALGADDTGSAQEVGC